jgi:protein SCO1/2
MSLRLLSVLGIALVVWAGAARAHDTGQDQRLPMIGPAPEFALISQDCLPVALKDFRRKVVAVTFIFTSCPDECPLLTAKMAQVQDDLGGDFGTKIDFVSITVDPQLNTPAVLKAYAESYKANLAGWSFLTVAPEVIQDLVRRYGGFYANFPDGDIEHTFLTSLVDADGMLRVQYLGVKFDPDEFRRDLLSLVGGP